MIDKTPRIFWKHFSRNGAELLEKWVYFPTDGSECRCQSDHTDAMLDAFDSGFTPGFIGTLSVESGIVSVTIETCVRSGNFVSVADPHKLSQAKFYRSTFAVEGEYQAVFDAKEDAIAWASTKLSGALAQE